MMMNRVLPISLLLSLLCAFLLTSGAHAGDGNDYPTRPIRIVIPYADTGPTAKLADALAPELSRELGQPVHLDFRGGDGATKGTGEVVAGGDRDGYTLLLHNIGMASAATFYQKLGYDPVADFLPIARLGDAPMVLLSRADLPVRTPKEAWQYIKRNERTLTVAYGGPGGAGQLCGLLLEQALAVRLFWVPFSGTGPALADLEKGRSDLLCDQTTHAMRSIDSGRVKAIAMASSDRLAVRPDLPTTVESGLPDLQVKVWHGLFAIKGTPAHVVSALARATRAAVQSPQYIAQMRAVGVEPATTEQATPAALGQLLSEEVARWRPIIVATGQYAD